MLNLFVLRAVIVFLALCWLGACAAQEPETPGEPTLAPQISEGKRLFTVHCAACHAVEAGTVIVGPSLFGVAGRAPERAADLTPQQYVEQSIMRPGDVLAPGFDDLMPANLGIRLSGEELDAIVAYVLSLQ